MLDRCAAFYNFGLNWKFIDGFLSGKMHFVKPSNQIV